MENLKYLITKNMIIDNLFQLDYMGVPSWEELNDADKTKQHQNQTTTIIPEKYEPDIKALCDYAGIITLTEGMNISITLHDILKICPRNRQRVDAYRILVRYLKEHLGVELIINSKKSKSNKNGKKLQA